MKQYKYFFKAYDENGQMFFFHRSNSASRLLKLAKNPAAMIAARPSPVGIAGGLNTISP